MKNRVWLFLLLVPVVGLMVGLNLESWEMAAIYGGTAAIEFGALGLILFLTANGGPKWLRFAPLALLCVPVYRGWQAWNGGSFLAAVAVLLYLLIALCGLCGWGAAWGLTAFKSFAPEEKAAEAPAETAEETAEQPGHPVEEPSVEQPETSAEEPAGEQEEPPKEP